MTRWRVALALVLLLAIGLVPALPLVELLAQPQAWQAYKEWPRLLSLAGHTLALVAGTLALALPAGVALAVLLYRTNVPLGGLWRFLAVLALFVPLPLFATAWQAVLGASGWIPQWVVADDPGSAWARGLMPAIWIHATAGLPWVIVLVGQGLRWVERELEEDALLAAGPWRVLWKVTLPRSAPSVFAAGLWVALQTATEMTVTDLMMVRTFAEEVYTQFVQGDDAGLARALAVSLPAILLSWAVIIWAARHWERTLPPLETMLAPPRCFPLGLGRWPCLAGVLLAVALLLGVPAASLVWKAGLAGSPQEWSAATVQVHLRKAWNVHQVMLAHSGALAAATGALTAALGLLACWLAIGSRWLHAGVLGLMAAVWAMPGPVVGIGLKDTIRLGMDVTGSRLVGDALYYGPSPLPILWAHLVRFFPCAVALLWPVVRLVPPELRDAARLDGARPWQEFWHIILPLTFVAGVRAALAVLVLALGELGASKLVETPGSYTFAREVFMQMHYGVGNDLAALCLLLLAAVAAAGTLVAVSGWLVRRFVRV